MVPLHFFSIVCLLVGSLRGLAQFPAELLVKNAPATVLGNQRGSATIRPGDAGGDSLRLLREGRHLNLLRKDQGGKIIRTHVAACFQDSAQRFSFVNDGPPQLTLAPGGRLYAAWSDNKSGAGNKDVFLTWSDDEGQNWQEPVLVTYRPNHHDQFMPALAIDPATSDIYLLYYDRQNSEDGYFTDLYLARSRNGGLLFDHFKVNPEPIPLTKSSPPGGTLLTVENGSVIVMWIQPECKSRHLFRSFITLTDLATYKEPDMPLRIEKTHAWSDTLSIPFDLLHATKISAIVTNPSDATFRPVTLVRNKKMKKGKQQLLVNARRLGLKKGTYVITLYCENLNTFVWIVDN